MTNVPSVPLTRTADRARAAAIVAGALHVTPIRSFTLVETVDAVSAAVLRTAGLDDTTIRAVLAALWEHPLPAAPAGQPTRGLQLTDREREFLRDLGQRLRTVRAARRLAPPVIRRMTGIAGDQLGDIERGIAVPTVLGLHRIADVLQVPLPLLVDQTHTPLELLRLLADSQDSPGAANAGSEEKGSPR